MIENSKLEKEVSGLEETGIDIFIKWTEDEMLIPALEGERFKQAKDIAGGIGILKDDIDSKYMEKMRKTFNKAKKLIAASESAEDYAERGNVEKVRENLKASARATRDLMNLYDLGLSFSEERQEEVKETIQKAKRVKEAYKLF